MIIKKPTFHLHKRGRPGGSFGLRIYIFQVCLFSPGLPRAPSVAVLGESLFKSIMLGAFLLINEEKIFWNWHEGKRNSHHSAPAEEDFLQSACCPPGKSLDVSSETLFIWIILKRSWCVKLEVCFASLRTLPTSRSVLENSENPVIAARWKNSPNFPLQINLFFPQETNIIFPCRQIFFFSREANLIFLCRKILPGFVAHL